jgi:hypothetical protein
LSRLTGGRGTKCFKTARRLAQGQGTDFKVVTLQYCQTGEIRQYALPQTDLDSPSFLRLSPITPVNPILLVSIDMRLGYLGIIGIDFLKQIQYRLVEMPLLYKAGNAEHRPRAGRDIQLNWPQRRLDFGQRKAMVGLCKSNCTFHTINYNQ